MINPIYPCLWLSGNAKQAAVFYTETFPQTRILSDTPFVTMFEVLGQKMMGLNADPIFSPNPSISFFVTLEDKALLSQVWDKLSENGKIMMPLGEYPWSKWYGWVEDSFGVSWQLSLGDLTEIGQAVCPCLMFTKTQAGKAEQAIRQYTKIFPDAQMLGIARYTEEEPEETGNIKHAQFHLARQVFMAMDSSLVHEFSFNEGISLVVPCETQAEIDYYWEQLSAGGSEGQCGWLKDAYGVSWQIVPTVLNLLMSDPHRAPRVAQAFMKMKKFVIADLLAA